MRGVTLVVAAILLTGSPVIAQDAATPTPHARDRWTVQLVPLVATWTGGGGHIVNGAVAEGGVHGFPSERLRIYAGVGLSVLPLVGFAGAMFGQDWFDSRLLGGRLRVNSTFIPRGPFRPGPEWLAGVRYAPSAVLRSPDQYQGRGELNANAFLLELGFGWRWIQVSGRVVHLIPTVLFGQTRFNVLNDSKALGWDWTIGGELAVSFGY